MTFALLKFWEGMVTCDVHLELEPDAAKVASPVLMSRGVNHSPPDSCKASVGAGANCLPAAAAVAGGRVSDPSLLEVTLAPVEALAKDTNQDIWVNVMDAAYSSPSVMNRIEAGGAVPFVDLNPKHSQLLQNLKETMKALKPLSKKAAKEGLTMEERKAWIGEARAISEGREARVPVSEKKGLLRRILRKFADVARRKGLAPGERRTEKMLRKKVMAARRDIQVRGTTEEKKVGLTAVPLGTIEWYLVYFLRGQNESINGLLKKRGALIGDEQHTSWVVGHDSIDGRVRGDLAGICLVAAVKVRVTGTTAHPMRAIHNWSRRSKSFWIIFVVRFCRKTPIKQRKKFYFLDKYLQVRPLWLAIFTMCYGSQSYSDFT